MTDELPDLSEPITRNLPWQHYEESVAKSLRAKIKDSKVAIRTGKTLEGNFSEVLRHPDVLISKGTMQIVVECKHWQGDIGLRAVESFIGQLEDTEVRWGLLVAIHPPTKSAMLRAAKADVFIFFVPARMLEITKNVELFDWTAAFPTAKKGGDGWVVSYQVGMESDDRAEVKVSDTEGRRIEAEIGQLQKVLDLGQSLFG